MYMTSQYETNIWSTHVNIVRLAEPISRCVRRQTQVFKIEGIVCKRFLPSPPPPPSFIFWLSFHFSRGQNRSRSFLRNQMETLATQAIYIEDIWFALPKYVQINFSLTSLLARPPQLLSFFEVKTIHCSTLLVEFSIDIACSEKKRNDTWIYEDNKKTMDFKNRLKQWIYPSRSLWIAGRPDSTLFGVVDDTTTTKFTGRACAVYCNSLPVVVEVLKFPNKIF